jgi:hypothetical protein
MRFLLLPFDHHPHLKRLVSFSAPLTPSLRLIINIGLTLTLSFTLLGCENPIDETPNVLPSTPSNGGDLTGEGGALSAGETPSTGATSAMCDGGAESEVGCGPCQDCPQQGTWYRFTDLDVISLDDNETHLAIRILNNLWAGDIDRHQLNILFEILETDGDQVRVRALNAAWISAEQDDYCVLPNTGIEFNFVKQGCAFTNPTPSGINIYAGSQNIPKNCALGIEVPHTIPVREVTLNGSFSEDCGAILNGHVPAASIPRSGLSQVCSCLYPNIEGCLGPDPAYPGKDDGSCAGCAEPYNSLDQQLNMLGPLDFNCTADGGEATCLVGSFTAERLDFTPPVCP